ncbi:Uncharacterised protein [Vibrio cholerae]|nr:Uncharacterised protein [Vibrio cholerae]CSD04345.1 Uncharacterised protein [Vibrio cholerae]
MAQQILTRIAAHKRHIQRPTRHTNERHIQQLLLEEKFRHWNAVFKHAAQHHNIRPTQVIGNQQIPSLLSQGFTALNIPFHAVGKLQNPSVHTRP